MRDQDVLNRFSLAGKVAIVTGATGRIGSVYARALAGAGARVVLTSRSADKLARLAEELGGAGAAASWQVCDLRDRQAIRAFASDVERGLGGVDVVVNNACPPPPKVETLGDADDLWQEMFDVVVQAPLVLCHALVEGMVVRGGGTIINIGSQAATKPYRWIAAYGAAKAALQTMTMYMAEAWGRRNIRCNLLVPSLMVSPQDSDLLATIATLGLDRRAALGRVGDPEEMAGPLVFLASDASSYVTGQVLVSGGDLFPLIERG